MIQVEAFGLNYAEVMARLGLYPDSPELPFIPGYDCVGTIVEIGPEVDPNQLGKRVAALTRFGSYAEYAISLENMYAEIPSEMDAADATAIGVQYNTAYYMACQAINLRKGEKVLIRAAAGGVGTALIQLCKWKGCEIVGMVGSDEKCEMLLQNGIERAVNYKDPIAMKQFEKDYKKKGFDVVFNPVAGKSFKIDFKMINPGGKLILFGASSRASKKRGKIPTMKMLWDMGLLIPILLVGQSRSIIGVNMLKIAMHKPDLIKESMVEVISLFDKGILKPKIGGRFNARDIAKAHQFLANGESVGKVVLVWE